VNELRDRFVTAVQPLAELAGELDAEVERLERELSEARELRRNVKQVLRTLNPKPKAPPKNEKLAETTRARHIAERAGKKQRVIRWVGLHEANEDITAIEALENPQGPNSNGDPQIGRSLMVELLDELRNEGLVRLDRVAQGGQQVYRRVM